MLSDFDYTITLRQAINGHKELSLAIFQPLMQGGLASTLMNYMIQDQDTLDLLKVRQKKVINLLPITTITTTKQAFSFCWQKGNSNIRNPIMST